MRSVLIAAALTALGTSAPGGAADAVRLGHAIALDDVGHLQALVQARQIEVNDVVPGAGYTAAPLIIVAARNAAIDVLRYLIAAKADLNARTPDGDTPLMLAALFGREEQPLNSAITQRYELAVRLLVEAGASLESAVPTGYSPLAYAAYAGRVSTVRYLLEKGARANASAQGRMSHVNTPLMMAAMQGHRDTALQLLRAGADAGIRVRDGMTALELAQKHQQTQLERALRCAEALKPGETFSQRCE